jgi:Trk-type K+ transport system membrane component
VLLSLAWLILVGNQFFPILLRLLIALFYLITGSQVLRLILEQPRRIYLYLFPAKETRLLFAVVLGILLVTWAWMLGFGWNRLNGFTAGHKVLITFFQSISSRVAGFNVIDLNILRRTTLLMFIGSMYVGVYPIAVSLRSSNIFLQREHTRKEVEHEIERIFARDLTYLFLAWLLISAFETSSLDGPVPRFSMFAILFEIISAYGNVGLSLGYPGTVTSLSAQWTPFSKLILCVVMYLGRHRAIPRSVDRAVTMEGGTQQGGTGDD